MYILWKALICRIINFHENIHDIVVVAYASSEYDPDILGSLLFLFWAISENKHRNSFFFPFTMTFQTVTNFELRILGDYVERVEKKIQ